MKAFAMFDHVMQWVARIFAISYLGLATLSMYTIFCGHLHAFKWSNFLILATAQMLFAVLVPVLWNIALWRLNKDIGRLYLVLSGGFLFCYFAYHLAKFFIMQPGPLDGKDSFGVAVLIGYFALAWTGFRSSAFRSFKLTPTLTTKTHSDSAPSTSRFFQNSLPSV